MRLTEVIRYRLPPDSYQIDDLPRLSCKRESKEIWKDILQNNDVRYIPVLRTASTDRDVVWLCSLDYSNGVDTLLAITGQDFIDRNIHRFLLLGNLSGVTKEYMINGKWKNIYQKLLSGDIIGYLRITEGKRGSHPLYKDYIRELCMSCIQADRLYIIKYMSIHGIEYFLDDPEEYLEYIWNTGPYNNLMNTKHYEKNLDFLINKGLSPDQLISGGIVISKLYNTDCYEYIHTTLGYTGECSFIDGTHSSVVYNRINFDFPLSIEDLLYIEDHIQDNYIEYDGSYYLSWINMKIDTDYLSMLIEILLDQGNKDTYRMDIKSSNITEPIGRLLELLKDKVDIRITFDYYHTDTNILWDLIKYGYHSDNTLDESSIDLREIIIFNNDYPLIQLLKRIS